MAKNCCNNPTDDTELVATPIPAGLPLNQIVQNPNSSSCCDTPPNPACITQCSPTPCVPSTTIVDPCNPSCQPIRTQNIAVLQRSCQSCGCEPCCCRGARSTGCCSNAANTAVQPYYRNVSMCPEDNTRREIIRQISQVFRNRNAFAMPACGAKVPVVFDGVTDIAIGAWMWAFGIGYLEVESFNAYTCEITLSNPCPSSCGDQVAPGTPIPACSLFVVTPPVCVAGNTTGGIPCLDSGFVAPVNGACVQIAVTNVNGLSVGKNVSINTGIYRVSAINSAVLITICNDGQGLTPGTVVDPGTNCAVPIILIDTNPCLNSQILCGVLLSCNGGVIQPVVGQSGQIPVANEDGSVCFRTLGIPVLHCTDLTVCLTLDPELPPDTAYLVVVGDTSEFTVGDILTIGGTLFTVDSIPDLTHIRLIPVDTVTTIITFPVGAQLCSADCCTELDQRLTIIEKYVINNEVPGCEFPGLVWLDADANQTDATPITNPTLANAGSPLVEGNTALQTIENNSCKNQMGLHFVIDYVWEISTFGDPGANQEIELIGQYNTAVANAPAPPVPVDVYHLYQTISFTPVTGSTGFCRYGYSATTSGYVAIPIFNSCIIAARANFNFGHGDLDHIDVHQLGCRITHMGVAVQV